MKPSCLFGRVIHPVMVTVFPSFCRLCGRALEVSGEKIVCFRCLQRVERHAGPYCPICGRFYHQSEASVEPCGQCLKQPPPFSRHRSLGPYSGRLKEVILLFKYKDCEALSRPLARMMYEHPAGREIFEGLDCILPVPLHRKREKIRGFNQAALLGRSISELSGVPFLSGVLVKTRTTPAQVSLEAADRESNLKGAFEVRKAHQIAGKTVLLVDDVFTTGSTLKECAGQLEKAGAREIRALTLARAV